MMPGKKDIYTSYMYSYPHKTAYEKIETVDIRDHKSIFQRQENHLYMHIPFCNTKCGYCNLFSVVGKETEYMQRYINAIEEQAKQLNLQDIKWETFTIGGGTPLILLPDQLNQLFTIVKKYFNFDTKVKFSCVETSPNETTYEKIEVLKIHNVKRVSIGVQSFLQQELDILHRNHSVESIRNSLKLIQKGKFDYFNMDIIYGIPTQSQETLQYSIDNALFYNPNEIFAYPLYRREDSTISKQYQNNENAYELYLFLEEYLASKGYAQTSMRCFTKDHSDVPQTCGFENTLSLGCGGRTYMDNLHLCTPYSNKQSICRKHIEDFIQKEDKTKMDFGYRLNRAEQKRRFVIKNLLFIKGIGEKGYEELFRSHLISDFPIINQWIDRKYCVRKKDCISLTRLGLSLSDYIGPMLISNEVREKMKNG